MRVKQIMSNDIWHFILVAAKAGWRGRETKTMLTINPTCVQIAVGKQRGNLDIAGVGLRPIGWMGKIDAYMIRWTSPIQHFRSL